MATMNVSLPDPMKEWVENRTRGGSYSNASDYVRHLIRKDQEREHAISSLQSLVTAGEESGAPRSFDPETFKADMHMRHSGK